MERFIVIVGKTILSTLDDRILFTRKDDSCSIEKWLSNTFQARLLRQEKGYFFGGDRGMTKTCAIIGCSPMCFPWGFDEEDEGCAALKLILINQITRLRNEGCTRFTVSMDCGVGLYAAEILHGLKESDDALETICFVPYEEQATKWTPELRDRYFNALAACTEFVNVAYEKTAGCEFKAYLEAMNVADTLIAVYNPDDTRCERETAAVAVAEMLNTQVVTVDPKAIHFFNSKLYPIVFRV